MRLEGFCISAVLVLNNKRLHHYRFFNRCCSHLISLHLTKAQLVSGLCLYRQVSLNPKNLSANMNRTIYYEKQTSCQSAVSLLLSWKLWPLVCSVGERNKPMTVKNHHQLPWLKTKQKKRTNMAKVKRARIFIFGLKVVLDRTCVGGYFVDDGVMLGSVIVGER